MSRFSLKKNAQPRLFAAVEIAERTRAQCRRDPRKLRRASFESEQHAHRIEPQLLHPRQFGPDLRRLPAHHRVYQRGKAIVLARRPDRVEILRICRLRALRARIEIQCQLLDLAARKADIEIGRTCNTFGKVPA